MVTKKLLIVANNIEYWRSFPDKIDTLQKWFAPKVQLAVTIVHTKFENIPFIQYEHPAPDQTTFKNRLGVDYDWYDDNVSYLARNYDIVLFVMSSAQWPKGNDMRGWRTDRTYGAVELQIGVGEYEVFRWGEFVGEGFFNLARHEILHALFMITGQNDTVHYWWNQSPAKLENCLNELSFVNPKEADRISSLQKIIAFLKALIPIQLSINKIKMEEEIMDTQKLPTKKDFCLAIQEYEGYSAPGVDPRYPNGTMAWRNKNPGNLRYAKQTGSTGSKNGFAVFPDYATGFAALARQIEIACNGKSKVFSPDMMLHNPAYISDKQTPNVLPGFFQKYAPSEDENTPSDYAAFVAKRLKVTTSFVIKDLL